MLNSDVICPFPFEALKKAHSKHNGEATIAVSLDPCFSFFPIVFVAFSAVFQF